ncbi:hypothetical protein M9458_051856, partial [Cirrhinus mrigala]
MENTRLTGSRYEGTPVRVGRGRGLLTTPIPFPDISPSSTMCSVNNGMGLEANAVPTQNSTENHVHVNHTSCETVQPISTSTPVYTSDIMSQMGNIVQQVGLQLADSIIAHLHLHSQTEAVSKHTQNDHVSRYTPDQSSTSSTSQIQVVRQREVKDPPIFRGDASDAVTLDEWVELMKNFIRKGFLPTEEQGEEILIHLRGKAKDVVKVGMLSNGLDIRTNPDAIYSLLRKHFSCQQYSPIPLQDFYTTLPEPQEDPFDYWLRLNRTADITAECLKQQGKVLDNQPIEVTRMFIRNCPNSDLALTFRSKTIDKWTAYEVQEILNGATGKGNKPSDCEKKFSVNEMHVSPTTHPIKVEQDSLQTKQSENMALEKVIDMLERVLMNNSGNAQAVKEHRKRSNMSRIPGLNDAPCLKPLSKGKERCFLNQPAVKLSDLRVREDHVDLESESPMSSFDDLMDYESLCQMMSDVSLDKAVIFQGVQRVPKADSLFYTSVSVEKDLILKALIDSGSMACTISESAEESLLKSNPDMTSQSAQDVVIVGCGGHHVTPTAVYDFKATVYGCSMIIPALVVPGQTEDDFGHKRHKKTFDTIERNQRQVTMRMMKRWRGESIPEKVGTVKLQRSVTLEPQTEHLVWGKLPHTVIVQPTESRSRPRQILVGRVITPLWGDGSIPLKVINPTNYKVVLKRNAKIADVDEMKQVLSDLNLNDLDLESCEVSAHWKDKLLHIIEKDKMDCGEAKGFVHRINLTDDRPFRFPYRRIPPSQYAKLRTVLNEMEEKGIIRKSHSDYASPLVLVWKKNGDLRICTDFRWLNARTVRDAYPLPHQSDVLAALGGNAFFSTMDLTSGYYNVPLEEEHKKYTAFSSPFGLHEYNRLPQGLSNSPATFMRMMMSVFGDENFSSVLCYLDDLMVFAPSESVALQRLEMVLSRLSHHNLKLAPKKCCFLRRSVKFLGHIISEEGIKTDPGKVEAINEIQASDLMEPDGKTPCQKKIRSFLGMVLYYQHFIEGCSAKAKPLFKLTSGAVKQTPVTQGRKPRKKVNYIKLSPADWATDCEEALHTLKRELTKNVTLAHPDFDQPFILAVDASFDGVGAVLSQVLPGEEIARPVAFASRTLSRSQMNYPAHSLELFALKWAICEKFSHWLRGRHFTAWTDNNPLTYILTKPQVDACEQRWVAKLASYSFDLKYVPGTKNVVADVLSREPFVHEVLGTVPAIAQLQQSDPPLQHSNIINAQGQDSTLSRILYYIERCRKPSKKEQSKESISVRKLLKHYDKMVVCSSVLYKKLYLFVVPASLKSQVLHGIHDAAGHQGRSRTLSLARQRFFWIGMKKDIDDYVKNCRRCVVGKTSEPNACAPLESIRTSEPLELVCIDFWSAEIKEGKSVDVLILTDNFTKMAHAFPCQNQSAKQVAKRLWNDFFLVYGFPKRIHSDQGANFESKLIKELLTMAGVNKSHTTPYHPMGNGIAEKFNRTLGSMIRTLPPKAKSKWPQMLQQLTFCYNCTEHETTSFAPFYLMFGRVPRLPVDVLFQNVLLNEDVVDYKDFVSKLRKDLREAAHIAQMNTLKEQERHGKLYNRKVKGCPLTVGDRVLVANRGEKGRRKVADKWESSPYEVMTVYLDINVYRIREINSDKVRIVHKNLLLPVNFLPVDKPQEQDGKDDDMNDEIDEIDLQGNKVDLDDRTANWILSNPDGFEEEDGRTNCTDLLVSDCMSEILDSASIDAENLQERSNVNVLSDVEGSDVNVTSDVDLPEMEGQDSNLTQGDQVTDEVTKEPVVCTQPRHVEAAVTQRLGRVIKPPKRLIYEMNKQHIDNADST